jgi:hypothetical protein
LRTTSSGSLSRTRTPERYGGAAPRGLLPGLVPVVDGQEGGSGAGSARRGEARQGRGRAPSAPPLRRGLAPSRYGGPVGL